MNFTIGWIAWLVVTITWFALQEGAALVFHVKGGTLSEHLRSWLKTDRQVGRWAWVITAGIGFAWFLVHIATPSGYLG